MKRVVILGIFMAVFLLALASLFVLKGKNQPEVKQNVEVVAQDNIADEVHTYNVSDVTSGCSRDDEIFCALEQAVKCTLAPELEGCVKEKVPSFILSRPDVTERPTEISFNITKIKPTAEGEIFVYTKSQCNTVWFGLCEGTVVYALENADGKWGVTNIYALED